MFFLSLILTGSQNPFLLSAENTENKNEQLSSMPDADFLEYLSRAIELDKDSNIIEPMELNELDQLGLLTLLNEHIETNKDLKSMNELSLKPKEDK